MNVELLAFDDIRLNPDFVNARPEGSDVSELAASIAKEGLLQPLVIFAEIAENEENEEEIGYWLAAGFRRHAAIAALRAAHQGEDEDAPFADGVPCNVREGSVEDASVLNLLENLQREDVPFASVAKRVAALVEGGLDAAALAGRLGKPERWAKNLIRFNASATTPVKKAVESGDLSFTAAQRIVEGGKDDAAQEKLLIAAVEAIKTDETERTEAIKAGKRGAKPSTKRTKGAAAKKAIKKATGKDTAHGNLKTGKRALAAILADFTALPAVEAAKVADLPTVDADTDETVARFLAYRRGVLIGASLALGEKDAEGTPTVIVSGGVPRRNPDAKTAAKKTKKEAAPAEEKAGNGEAAADKKPSKAASLIARAKAAKAKKEAAAPEPPAEA